MTAKTTTAKTTDTTRKPRTRKPAPAPVVEPTPAVKVCKKDPSHGPHRITKSGSYCYACDRLVAEAQKAARKAAASK